MPENTQSHLLTLGNQFSDSFRHAIKSDSLLLVITI